MIALIGHYWAGLLLSLLIGLATGWWAWNPRAAGQSDEALADEPIEWPPREANSLDLVAAVYEADDPNPDDLTAIKGIDPQIERMLRGLGVTRFTQIAGWLPEDIERIDGQLGEHKGRLIHDEWIAQARLLARGEHETFAQRYGHL